MPRIEGFPPIAAPDARALILGSMPSAASLRAGQYYGHPRNAFWWIMGELFGAGPALPYAERAARLRQARVAVWDVLHSCAREGSLDSSIDPASERANDFGAFFRRLPDLECVLFNGHKAEQAFRRHVLAAEPACASRLRCLRLPSTSPAMAAAAREAKLKAWRAALDRLA